MGDKMYKLDIKVDLSCCRCRQAIQDYLCRMQRKVCMQIVSIEYDEKKDVVLVSCTSNPEQLKRKLLCKLPRIIIGIDIKVPQTKPVMPIDPRKQDFMKKCEEEYMEISKCIEKCKKECECKCKPKCECEEKFKCNCKPKCECEEKFKCKCKPKCECEEKFKCKCKPKCECEEKFKCKCKPQPKPPMDPSPPQVTIVCCARPCPCWTAWSNNYRCCSCGVESWPGRSGPGWGSGPSYGGNPQWGNCEPSRPPNMILESTAPPCSIM